MIKKFIPNWKIAGLKNRNEAFKHMVECLLKNPACAGADGCLDIHVLGKWWKLKPIKRAPKENKYVT